MKKGPNFHIEGREQELAKVRACVKAGRNVLLEGPVGVGKTHLALAVTGELGRSVFRVDGDSRYSEQKLSGWFDPPTVLKKGFSAASFMAGPLVDAMKSGGVLFINELNRLPEGVQNVLLPAIDERRLQVPRMGEVKAKDGFLVIATQNPKEFVATSHLSEAILDRFELVLMDYQPEAEELQIVERRLLSFRPGILDSRKGEKLLPLAAVRMARVTRGHARIRRGASVRAAISTAEIAAVLMEEGTPFSEAFIEAVLLAFPTRIELERDSESDGGPEEARQLLRQWAREILEEVQSGSKKKT